MPNLSSRPFLNSFYWRWTAVWRRNFNVWRKLLLPSLIGNFGDPLIYLLALGYGLGKLIPNLYGLPYLVFLASGIVCSSAMNAATFEGMFSAFTRMTTQKTWEAMLTAPLTAADIVLGETLWAATKGLINSVAILIVASLMGLVANWHALLVLPVIFILACCFAAMALIVTAIAKSYDFFTYYITLLITPMMLLSGVFFPIQSMPLLVQHLASWLPLYHGINIIRPLMTGQPIYDVALHLMILIIYAVITYLIAAHLIRRRLIG